MALPHPHHRYTYQEYLVFERNAGMRCEFHDGEIYAMAGGSFEHSALGTRMSNLLSSGARDGCIAHGADQKIYIPAEEITTYADALLVCGRAQPSPNDKDSLSNPRVVVEVLSPSSEKYDRAAKRELYMTLPSLESYIVVAQNQRCVQVWNRTQDGWATRAYGSGDAFSIPALEQPIPTDDIYEGILDPEGRSLL